MNFPRSTHRGVRITLALLVSASCLLGAVVAQAEPLLVGGRLGGNWVQLNSPTDPAGEPTVLYGTSFTGLGFQGGAAAQLQLMQLGPGPLLLDADLLFSYRRALGYAESRTSAARRELILRTTALHLPVLVGLGIRGDASLLQLSVGPELMLGLGAGSTTRQTGVEGTPETLEVRPTTHVGLTGKLGMMFDVIGGKLPIDLRFTFDPGVPSSTRERFDEYVDFANPGRYGVQFNLQAMLTIGYMLPIGSGEDDAPMGEPEVVEEPAVEEEPEADEDSLF